MPKIILISVIAYREKYLAEAIRSYYETAAHPENLRFSVISEQMHEWQHADLSFIPSSQIVYRKYDLSEYRGIMWSRTKTVDVEFEYDYILYTCGHNVFTPHWDTYALADMRSALSLSSKPILLNMGPEYEYLDNGSHSYAPSGDLAVRYRTTIGPDYVPGYGFPNDYLVEVPGKDGLLEAIYIQFSWVFTTRECVDDVPLNPDVNYHAEEIWMTIHAFDRGWDLFHTQRIMYYHDTHKMYPGEEMSRTISHRPWSDLNKDAFWKQSDETERALNKLLSGNGGISKETINKFCAKTGLNPKWCVPIDDYASIGLERHGEQFRLDAPIISD